MFKKWKNKPWSGKKRLTIKAKDFFEVKKCALVRTDFNLKIKTFLHISFWWSFNQKPFWTLVSLRLI